MASWKDIIKNGSGNVSQSEYETKYLSICIVSNHIHNPGVWVLHCRELGLSCYNTGAKNTDDIEIVKERALSLIELRLQNMLQSIRPE